jgi:glucose/arabinose dehydrogenase
MELLPAHPFGRAALTAAAVLVLSSCGGGSSPSPGGPSVGAPAPVPGATMVNGSERLAWNQTGEVSGMQFLAYVDGSPVTLGTAACAGAPDAECSAPLPPLTDGVHTIALAALSAAGLESGRSDSITVQKVSTRSVVSAASFPDARVLSGEPLLEATVTTTSGGLAFAADVVARALKAPLQLASTPDGRLLVAEADGRVRVIHPGEPERGEAALDARALLDPPPVGPPGLALHPDFARNHFVYLSFLAQDGPERTLLRIVRLREVGDALGEPAALFEAPVAVAPRASRIANDGRNPVAADGPSGEGPRLAFGPDGLLYALLPPGIEFDNEPAASRPTASMLWIEDDGRVPDIGPLSGITTPPLGYAWHPGSDALWLISPAEAGEAVVHALTAGTLSRVGSTGRPVLRLTEGRGASSGAFRLVIPETQAGTLEWSSAFAEGLDYQASGTIRLAMPILAESLLAGMSGRISDVVAAGGGTLYLATDSAGRQGGDASTGSDVVVRLRARPR